MITQTLNGQTSSKLLLSVLRRIVIIHRRTPIERLTTGRTSDIKNAPWGCNDIGLTTFLHSPRDIYQRRRYRILPPAAMNNAPTQIKRTACQRHFSIPLRPPIKRVVDRPWIARGSLVRRYFRFWTSDSVTGPNRGRFRILLRTTASGSDRYSDSMIRLRRRNYSLDHSGNIRSKSMIVMWLPRLRFLRT